jgi:hypothetical protein
VAATTSVGAAPPTPPTASGDDLPPRSASVIDCAQPPRSASRSQTRTPVRRAGHLPCHQLPRLDRGEQQLHHPAGLLLHHTLRRAPGLAPAPPTTSASSVPARICRSPVTRSGTVEVCTCVPDTEDSAANGASGASTRHVPDAPPVFEVDRPAIPPDLAPIGGQHPSTIRIVVVLPAPLLPTKPNSSPARTSKVISCNASTSPYRLETPSISNRPVIHVLPRAGHLVALLPALPAPHRPADW